MTIFEKISLSIDSVISNQENQNKSVKSLIITNFGELYRWIMVTLIYSLSVVKDRTTGKQDILMHFFHGRHNQRAKTNLITLVKYWDEKTNAIRFQRSGACLSGRPLLSRASSKWTRNWRRFPPSSRRSLLKPEPGRLSVLISGVLRTCCIASRFPKENERVGGQFDHLYFGILHWGAR